MTEPPPAGDYVGSRLPPATGPDRARPRRRWPVEAWWVTVVALLVLNLVATAAVWWELREEEPPTVTCVYALERDPAGRDGPPVAIPSPGPGQPAPTGTECP